ncbi:MAG: hypothetical protein Q4B57_00800 [Eubacteriales bacterium]|nr:hypothetical protein [Eubacteriales bacterium]
METWNSVVRFGLKRAYHYIEKNPEENLPRLMDWVDRFAGERLNSFPSQRRAIREAVNDQKSPMHELILNILHETDTEVLKEVFENFFLNANLVGRTRREEAGRQYHCKIPWAIHLTASEKGRYLSFDELDAMILQGKELGIYMYIYSDAEPLEHKQDLVAISRKHHECQFLAFTDGRWMDEELADIMLEVKNIVLAIRDGETEGTTDEKYDAVAFEKKGQAMELLKRKKLPFGIGCSFDQKNLAFYCSDEYLDQIIRWGAKFIWYIPEKSGESGSGMTQEQSAFLRERMRKIRETKPIFAAALQIDEEDTVKIPQPMDHVHCGIS